MGCSHPAHLRPVPRREAYAADVRSRRYPEPDHEYTMAPDEAARLEEMLS